MLHKKLPDLSHLRVFGCLYFATMLNNNDKFKSKAIPSVFMGYLTVQKGYLLFNIHSKTFFISRDVIFHENLFPFQSLVKNSPLFPVSSSSLELNYDFLHIPIIHVHEALQEPFTP